MIETVFENPGVEWRGKPFWSWNGALEKDELIRQIDILKEMGMGGFFMHSRTGLETEYLGEEWFKLINECADYAETIGLEAWLYDEDRWPSGLAGGIVSKHPEYRQKFILLEIDPQGVGENVLAEFLCDLDGIACTNLEQVIPLSGDLITKVVASPKTHLRFSAVEQGRSGFYNGYTYIDTLNRDATEAFLKSTHEKYASHCGDRLGKSIKGIFTDEPHRGALLDGFSMYREDGASCLPYTQKLFAEFESRFGYDLKSKLPELFLQVDGKRISAVKWDYVELLQQLFLENYAVPCQEWCDQYGLVLTGHVLHEDNLTAQTAMSGSVMRYYEHMSAPGVDVLTEGNRNYWIVKQLTSAARQTGKKQLLSELYGCTGWQMPFAGHKAVGDWQALLGINLRCHHLSWYTMRGEAKRDYPASILHQSAWYKEYAHVEDYFARFGMMMAQGEPVCDLLVMNPVETLWSQVHLGWSKGLGLQDEHLATIEERYQTLFTWLMESQVDFDYGDEEMLARLGAVEGDLLAVGDAKYKTVLIAGMETIRSSTLKILNEFRSKGGRVIVVGDAPTHIDAVESSVCVAACFDEIEFQKDAVLRAVPKPLATVDAPDVFGQLRQSDDELIFAALNVNREKGCESVVVRMQTDFPIEEWDCETGVISDVCSVRDFGCQVFETNFAAAENKVWVARSREGEIGAVAPFVATTEEVTCPGPFSFKLSEPNICVLDAASYRLDDGEWVQETDVLKIDRGIRESNGVLRRGGEMLQPWFTAQQPVKELCTVELRFTFEIETMPSSLDLVLEEPENFIVEINGRALETSLSVAWTDIAMRKVRIPGEFLSVGQNEISLETRYKENSNLEAIYLVGPFGVRLDGVTRKLIPMVDEVTVGDLCSQGFPFYSGCIIYEVPVPRSVTRLSLPEIGGACAKIAGQVVGWAPFEADVCAEGSVVDVEIILTRRNTFGPLHDAVLDRAYNGPDHWLTEGDEFSEVPVFIPSGLLGAPCALFKV